MNDLIRSFTSKAAVPVTYLFDGADYSGRVVIRDVEHRTRTDKNRSRSGDDSYAFAGGLLFGSML